ncbi:MAG: EI24 domain-containing protein [Paracoccaceae bacterium]|nr:EI24 domain-containing protein [Paracoccaceae bacterium]
MIVSSFLAALGQMGDARFRGVLLKGVGLTIALLVAFYAAFVWSVGLFIGDSVTLPWIGTITWVDEVISWAAIPLMLVLSVFLMVPVASAITSMFLEDVADAVEDRHYPQFGQAPKVPISEALRDTLSFLGVLIVANLAALVLYLFFPPFAPFIFWSLNGFLLGREYFTLAAMRRVGRDAAKVLWRRHLATIWAAGVLMALPLTIPVMNLVIPVLGAATFTHIFHRINARG